MEVIANLVRPVTIRTTYGVTNRPTVSFICSGTEGILKM